MTTNSNEEKKEDFATYNQYFLSFFITVTLMFMGAGYFYNRIYRPLIKEKNDPEMSTPEFIARKLFYCSPSPDLNSLRNRPNFEGKRLFPDDLKTTPLAELTESNSESSLDKIIGDIADILEA